MNKLIKNIVKNKRNCYFVSPHLDDAALSAGGIISYLAKKTNVEVITVFTECREDKHSLSALSYIKQSGYKSDQAKQLYSLRRKEDLEAFNRLGVEVKHLGFVDALWRRKRNIKMIDKFLGTFLNDFLYI